MRKILSLLLLALVATAGHAEVFQRDRGVATTLNFKLYNADGTLDVDEADGGTEVSVSCDEGAETTATNDFVDEGTFYSIALTAAEMECNRIAVVVAATTTEVFFIDTKTPGVITAGTAQSATATTLVLDSSVAYADDELNGATIVLTGGTGAGQRATITDYVGATDTATVATWTTTPSGTITYQIHGTALGGGSVSIASGGITAASFAAGAIDAAAIAADAIGASELATDAIGAAEIAADAIGASEIAASAVGASEVADGAIDAATFAAGAINAAAIATDAIGAAEIAADAIGASEIAADAIGASELATDAIGAAEIAANAIGAAEVADATIDAATFAAGAIDATAIATDAIGAAEIAADAVGASEIAANAIGASEIADNAIDAASTAADFSTEVQDADIESINGVTILGDGGATPFGP